MEYDKYDNHYRGIIETTATPVEVEGVKWWDISEAGAVIYDAIRYLRVVGKLITHPSNILVRFK